MNFSDLLDSITPEVYANLKRAVELGKWPNGEKLSRDQREHCMQAVIGYEMKHLPSEQHSGYIPPKSHTHCGGEGEVAESGGQASEVALIERAMTMHAIASGHLAKMRVEHAQPVRYQLPLDDQLIDLNPLLGRQIRLQFCGEIHCQHCGRKTKKSFNQGYCYPCFKKLAQCDSCILSPEKCHYDAGTCREPEWGERNCMTDHIVYLANSSGIKVGITRASQVPTRWIDQGAVQALPIFRVATRQQSGFVEDVLRQLVPDRTNWRALLKGDIEYLDLPALRDELLDNAWNDIVQLQNRFGLQAIEVIDAGEVYEFDYPVQQYLRKATTHNLDKNPTVEGTLLGIRGQYLLLDSGAINIRKFGAYYVQLLANTN